MKQKIKTINQICAVVDLIIEKKADKNAHKDLYFDLCTINYTNINFLNLVRLCNTVLLMAKTKNQVIRYLESDFWDSIIRLPFKLVEESDVVIDIDKNEELLPNEAYANETKKSLSLLLDLCYQVLDLKNEGIKSSDQRRSKALKTIASIFDYYVIKDIKTLLLKSIESKGSEEKNSALQVLEHYYESYEDEIDNDLIEKLNKMFDETDDDIIAYTCLQILVNAEVLDEFEAMDRMDEWKHEKWGKDYDSEEDYDNEEDYDSEEEN